MSKYTPTVYVIPKAYQLMSLWAKLGGQKSREMTCFGRAEIDSRGDVYITDAYMVAHEADSGGVDADDDDINKLMFELDQKGIPPDEAFRCWVHSHPGRGDKATYLSMTDEAMIDRFMLGEFLVSIVFDSVGESPYCRIDFKSPRVSIEADVEIYIPYLTAAEVKEATDTYKEKARSKPVVLNKYKGGSYATKLTKGESRVTKSHGLGTGWDDEDVDWGGIYAGAGTDADADTDPGTEMTVEVPEYEMTATEYAYFNASMAGEVDNIAQQVLGAEMEIDDALDDLVKMGYSKSQAVEEMEFRLGSTVDTWRDEEDGDRLRDEALEDQEEQEGQELLEFEAVPEPVESDPPGFWSALTQGDGANDTRKIQ
jgi:hypothetical protein